MLPKGDTFGPVGKFEVGRRIAMINITNCAEARGVDNLVVLGPEDDWCILGS